MREAVNQNGLVHIERRGALPEPLFHQAVVAFERNKWTNLSEPQIRLENLPRAVAENIITPKTDAIPDCVTCGACCAFLSCVAVKPTDSTPADFVWEITNETRDGGAITVDRFMRRTGDEFACVALDGQLGEQVGCRIYPERPQVCREFEAGSDKCRALRRAYQIEPELDEARRLEAAFRVALFVEQQNPTEKIVYARIVEHPETNGEFVVVALLDSGENKVLHIYRSKDEIWLQSDFAGLTLNEAYAMILARQTANQPEASPEIEKID